LDGRYWENGYDWRYHNLMATICYGTDQIYFADLSSGIKLSEILPFRVKFVNIAPGTANPGTTVPPIGIAILGVNNYIL
jgi:hypothetical protein